MLATLLDPIMHAVISLALIAAYGALRWHGVDEPVLLGLIGGQLGGLGVSSVAQKVAAATGTPESTTTTVVNTPPTAP